MKAELTTCVVCAQAGPREHSCSAATGLLGRDAQTPPFRFISLLLRACLLHPSSPLVEAVTEALHHLPGVQSSLSVEHLWISKCHS